MTIEPYTFQQECIDRLGDVNIPGRLVADEMGLLHLVRHLRLAGLIAASENRRDIRTSQP